MTTAARLDLRLNSYDKTSIHRVAELRGVPLAAFVREAALRRIGARHGERAHIRFVCVGIAAFSGGD